MGIIKVWELLKDVTGRWRSTLKEELTHHRTRINEMLCGNGQLWTGKCIPSFVFTGMVSSCPNYIPASSDDTVQVLPDPSSSTPSETQLLKPAPPITHPVAVRSVLPLLLTDLAEPYIITGAGDIIRVYDVSSPEDPELVGEVDAHWHDVTAIRLWVRKSVGVDGKTRIEPWIVSTSLDSTIRKWRLSGECFLIY